MVTVFPKQHVTNAERNKKDEHGRYWAWDCCDYFADQIAQGNNGDKNELLTILKACEGNIDEDVYSYVLNPYGVKGNEKIRKFPARLRNYDIMSIVFETALGEKASEPDTSQVTCTNKDVEDQMMAQHNQEMNSMMIQEFINNLNAMGVPTEIQSKQVEDYQKKNTMFHATVAEKKAIDGQDKLEYLKADKRIKNMSQTLFADWLKVDQCYTYKEVNGNDIIYQTVPCYELYAFMSKNSDFVEDGYAAVRHQRLSLNEIVDLYYEDLKDVTTDDYDPLKILEETNLDGTSKMFSPHFMNSDLMNKPEKHNWKDRTGHLFDTYHTTWKTFRLLKEVYYVDPLTGIPGYKCCDEDYKMDEEAGDISVEDVWVNWVYEVTRLDPHVGDPIYLRARPLPVQRNEFENKSICKLPYNGLCMTTIEGKTYSWGSRGMNWQVICNIMRYQMEKTINKNKDKILVLAKGLIPSDADWDEDKWMYFADALGIAIVDETSPNFALAIQAMKSVDMSLSKYIGEMHNLIQGMKMEYYASIGFTQQRMGDVKTSAGKAATETAVMRSFVTSKEKFRKFDEFMETELNGLMDYSKVAWVDGKKAEFVNPTGKIYQLDIDGLQHANTQYGIFVRDVAKENDALQTMKQWGFSMAQNDRDPEMLAEMVEAGNVSKIKAAFRKYKEIQMDYEQMVKKQELDSNERVQSMISKDKDKEIQKDIMMGREKNAAQVKAALITSRGMAKDVIGLEDLGELEGLFNAIDSNLDKIDSGNVDDNSLNLMMHDEKMQLEYDKLADKQDERASKEKVAKMNKN